MCDVGHVDIGEAHWLQLRAGYSGMVCTLIPSRAKVKLGFYGGASIHRRG